MRNIAALLVAIPVLASAQDAAQQPAGAAQPQPAAAPQQQAPQYAPPPPPAYAPPPPQYAPQGQVAQPPQYSPQGQYPQYAPAQQGYPPPSGYRPPNARRERQRDSWYIGFGLGGGDGGLKDADGTLSFKEFLGKTPTTVSLNFKLGATVTPRLLVGGDITAIDSEAEEGSASASIMIVNYDAVATFFPMERGLYLRGGVGVSKFTLKVDSPLLSGSDSFTGMNVLGGVGYAFWLGQTFNLAVNLDYSAQFWGDHDGGTTGPQRSSFWTLGLGFDWY